MHLKGCRILIILGFRYDQSFPPISLAVRTSNVLSVQTPWGLVRPRYLPEGVGPASGVLQRTVMQIFEDYQEFMITIFDNLLVLCHDYTDEERKLNLVINRAYEIGVVLKFAKSWIGHKTVTFFGYVIRKGNMSCQMKEKIVFLPFLCLRTRNKYRGF